MDAFLKQDPENLEYLLEMAIALFGLGKIDESFEMLLKSIKIDKEWNEQAAKKQLLEFFSSAGIEAKETKNARKKLATWLPPIFSDHLQKRQLKKFFEFLFKR